MSTQESIRGREALETLAKRFPQLYVAPSDNAEKAHRMAAGRGIAPEGATLDHFVGSDLDDLRTVQTPAGDIEVLFLERREDFETLLQIVGHRAKPEPIARTIGAITYFGLADWGKVRARRAEYLASGGDDWSSEFARLAKVPGEFRSQLIVISEGPYSNIEAKRTPYDDEEWIRVSREIRLHHECAHVVCRRLMPKNIQPVWDEVTADVVGLLCATGTYNVDLAALFLGVAEDGFSGGRLSGYLDDEQQQNIDKIAREVFSAMTRIATEANTRNAAQDAFAFLLALKEEPYFPY